MWYKTKPILQSPEFSAIIVNTTVKMELPSENRIGFGKWNFAEKLIFHQVYISWKNKQFQTKNEHISKYNPHFYSKEQISFSVDSVM